jgi:hypothetical protein
LAVTCLVFAMIATGCHATHESHVGDSPSPSPDPHAAALAVARELYDDWMSGKLDAARSLATPDVRLKAVQEAVRRKPTSEFVFPGCTMKDALHADPGPQAIRSCST